MPTALFAATTAGSERVRDRNPDEITGSSPAPREQPPAVVQTLALLRNVEDGATRGHRDARGETGPRRTAIDTLVAYKVVDAPRQRIGRSLGNGGRPVVLHGVEHATVGQLVNASITEVLGIPSTIAQTPVAGLWPTRPVGDSFRPTMPSRMGGPVRESLPTVGGDARVEPVVRLFRSGDVPRWAQQSKRA